MGLFDDAVPGGNITKPLMLAVGALLIGKMMGGSSTSEPVQAPRPAQGGSVQSGGGQSGGSMGGSLMGGLGGLLERLSNSGHGETVNSWLGSGQNAHIPPDRLGSAIGQTTVSDLARNAGMSEQELLVQLSRVLPGVVDKLTPDGRVPEPAHIRSAFGL